MLKIVLESLLGFVVENKENLARNRFSGVHLTEMGYRVHISSLIRTNVLNIDPSIVGEVANSFQGVEWDKQSLWFTIQNEHDHKQTR